MIYINSDERVYTRNQYIERLYDLYCTPKLPTHLFILLPPTSRIHYLNLSNSEYDRWSDPIKGDDSPSNYDSGTYEWLKWISNVFQNVTPGQNNWVMWKTNKFITRPFNYVPYNFNCRFIKDTFIMVIRSIIVDHHNDVTMGVIASQITSNSVVYLTICSDQDQRNIKAPHDWPFVRGIHRSPVNSPHLASVTRKKLPFGDIIMGNAR